MTEIIKKPAARYIIPLFVFLLLIVFTAIISNIIKKSEEEKAFAEFEIIANDVADKVSTEAGYHTEMLRDIKSFFEASDYVTQDEWNIYIETIKNSGKFPGIKTLSFLPFVKKSELNDFLTRAKKELTPDFRITPEGEREKYFPIYYFTKFMESDLTYGMDHFAFAPRSNTIYTAVETGSFQITELTKWLFNDPVYKTQRGLIIYVPVYKKGLPHETPEQRWNAVNGVISCAVVADVFFQSLIKSTMTNYFDAELYIGKTISEENKIVGLINKEINPNWHPKFKKVFEDTFCGKPVTLIITSTVDFETHKQTMLSEVILLSGGLIALIFSLFILYQIKSHHKTLELLKEIKEAKELLEKQNKEKAELIKEIEYENHMFNELMDNITDTVYFKDLNSRFLRLSKEFLRKTGAKSQEELIGKTDFDLFSEEHARQAFEDEQQIIKTGVPIIGKVEKETWNDGRTTYALTTKMPYRDKDGKIVGIFGISKDITELKNIQEHLAREKELFEITLASIGDAVISTDVEGRIVLMNRVAESLTGWKKEEAIGKMLTEVFVIVNAETRAPALNPVKRVLETGVICGLANNTLLIAKDNTERIIADSAAPIKATDGRTVGVVLVFRDVTEKHQRQGEMIKAARLEMFERLASGLAHEFNNIMTAILGNISILKTSIDRSSDSWILLERAERECFRARNITGQLLIFTKGGEPVKKRIDIIPVIKQAAAVGLYGSSTMASYDLPETPVYVEGDSTLLEQAITHLISYSVAMMNKKGSLFISVSRATIDKDSEEKGLEPGDYVKIVLQDHSRGMSHEELAKLFEPYSTNLGIGSGLGLASSKLIIIRHGGKIDVISIPERGNTFTIYIPASKIIEEEQKTTDVPVSRPRGKKILFMDNEQSICELVKIILEQAGYIPDICYDGSEAIDKYRDAMEAGTPYDLVILDYTVEGGMGGKETLVELKKIDPNVRAVISTGFAVDPVIADFKKFGFIGALQKPYNAKELRDFVSKFI
jgi:PAS domain S-box-containing protein